MNSEYSPYDAEEKEFMDEIEEGKWIPVSKAKRKELFQLAENAAINYHTKSARMSIRLTEADMIKLKLKHPNAEYLIKP